MRLFASAFFLCLGIVTGAAQPPRLARVFPLGGQAGTTVSLEILGERLSNVSGVEFDCRDLVWKQITRSSPGKLVGEVWISPSAALGAHTIRVVTLDGPTNSGLFNVGSLPSIAEVEPNDKLESAVAITSFPVDIQGRLDGAPDADVFSFTAKAGERLVFDLKSIEDGSAVEVRIVLLDSAGKRVGFNDDRDDYNENPRLEHTFATAGKYFVKLDQYRGPRGFNFGKLCAYILRAGSLPVVTSAQPRAMRRGSSAAVRLTGSGLHMIDSVFLTELRQAEYARMTYPYTMPIHFRRDAPAAAESVRVSGEVKHRGPTELEAAFSLPASVTPGLWRLWVAGKNGTLEAATIEVTDSPVRDEASANSAVLDAHRFIITGALSAPGEKDRYRINARAGQPLHFWTVAEQIGVPYIDSVLTLRDVSGKKLAENDDVVAGQGTLLGNPDSSLFFTPQQDGVLTLEVRDRTGRGGTGYEYALKSDLRPPVFQLFTTPENFTVAQGESGEIKVHLVREAGFVGEVDVWVEGLGDGVAGPRGRFRADQLFEPNADGADMIIPEIGLRIDVPQSMPSGTYPIRILGAATIEAGNRNGRVVEAHATLMLGPLLDAWNFIRRPLPTISMTVVQPFPARLTSDVRTLRLEQGKSATLDLKAVSIPKDASFRFLDLPEEVQYRVIGREGDKISLSLEAGKQTAAGTYEIAAEADLGSRRVASPSIVLTIP
jgi:hypothetical protein